MRSFYLFIPVNILAKEESEIPLFLNKILLIFVESILGAETASASHIPSEIVYPSKQIVFLTIFSSNGRTKSYDFLP